MTPAHPPAPKRRGRIGRIDVPSPRLVAAAALVTQLSAFRQVIEDVERRTIPLAMWDGKGERRGIILVLNEAQVCEAGRTKLVADLEFTRDKVRNFVVAIGDDRRERGAALPIPWFPEMQTPAGHDPNPAGVDSDSFTPNDGAPDDAK
ncbi:MAG: hypothetical protein ACLQVF_32690 [Isosphaeraceae bacterium]